MSESVSESVNQSVSRALLMGIDVSRILLPITPPIIYDCHGHDVHFPPRPFVPL